MKAPKPDWSELPLCRAEGAAVGKALALDLLRKARTRAEIYYTARLDLIEVPFAVDEFWTAHLEQSELSELHRLQYETL